MNLKRKEDKRALENDRRAASCQRAWPWVDHGDTLGLLWFEISRVRIRRRSSTGATARNRSLFFHQFYILFSKVSLLTIILAISNESLFPQMGLFRISAFSFSLLSIFWSFHCLWEWRKAHWGGKIQVNYSYPLLIELDRNMSWD